MNMPVSPMSQPSKSKAPVIVGAAVAVAAAGAGGWYFLQQKAIQSADVYLQQSLVPQLAKKNMALTYASIKTGSANSIEIVDAKLVNAGGKGEPVEITTPTIELAVTGRSAVDIRVPGPVNTRNEDGLTVMTFPSALVVDLKTDGTEQQNVEGVTLKLPAFIEVTEEEKQKKSKIAYDANPVVQWETKGTSVAGKIDAKNLTVTGEGKPLPYLRAGQIALDVNEEQKAESLRTVDTALTIGNVVVADEKSEAEAMTALNADNPVTFALQAYAETTVTAEQVKQGMTGEFRKLEVKNLRFDYGPQTMLSAKGSAEADRSEPMPYGSFTLNVGGYNDMMNTVSAMGLVEGKDMTAFRAVADKVASYGEMKGQDLELVVSREKGGQAKVGKVPFEQAMQEVMMLMMSGGQETIGEMPPVEQRELTNPPASEE